MSIQRLTLAMRNMARLHKSEAKMMHVVPDRYINQTVLNPSRYNIRTKEGDIAKFTIGENVLKLSFLSKIGNRYESAVEHIVEGTPEIISARFAEMLEKIGKSSANIRLSSKF